MHLLLEDRLNHIHPEESKHEWAKHFSSFSSALSESRFSTRRDQFSGEKFQDESHGSFLGTLGYFALLDQIGNCFFHKKSKGKSLRGIKSALAEFTELCQDERDSLYALRCSLAHDFSFVNKDPKDEKGRFFRRFTVVADGTTPLLIPAERKWSGDISDCDPAVFTVVNLEAFGDLVESIVTRMESLIQTEEISIRHEGGITELNARYSYSIVNQALLEAASDQN